MRFRPAHAAALALFAGAGDLFALGTESFGNQPVVAQPEWPAGTADAVNLQSRVYSRWINGNESFFFRGATTDLQQALSAFAAIKVDPTLPLEVIVVPIPGETKTFKGTAVACDWELRVPSGLYLARARKASAPDILPLQPSLVIFAGSKTVDLTAVRFPAGVKVIGPDELVECHLQGLKSSNDDVVATSLQSLGEHSWALKSLDPVIACLRSEREYVRVCAAGALGQIGAPARNALELLRAAELAASKSYRESFRLAIEALEREDAPATAREQELRARVRKLVKEQATLESPARRPAGSAPGAAG